MGIAYHLDDYDILKIKYRLINSNIENIKNQDKAIAILMCKETKLKADIIEPIYYILKDCYILALYYTKQSKETVGTIRNTNYFKTVTVYTIGHVYKLDNKTLEKINNITLGELRLLGVQSKVDYLQLLKDKPTTQWLW
jgi:hypothetical protein